jgi:two-component system nitrate/nitrite response regulator NarL
MKKAIRLLVVDDHPLFRRGLVSLLSQDSRFSVVGEAGDIGEAFRILSHQEPDLLLLDNHLPGVKGVEAIVSLKQGHENLRILMLTVSEDEDDLANALQNGADGYLLKTLESDQLCEAIVKVAEGQSVVSPEMMSKLVSALRQPTVPSAIESDNGHPLKVLERLSPREMEIFLLIAKSLSNKHIARDLNIAETTVKIHIQHIFKKLEMTSRVQVAVLVATYGLS